MGEQQTPDQQRRSWAVACRWGLVVLLFVLALMLRFVWGGPPPGAAAKATCLSNIANLARAMRLYAQDYNGYLFFDHANAFSQPLRPGDYGQRRYLKEAMKQYIPYPGIWYCPEDRYAKRDFTADEATSGTFNYRRRGLGYVGVRHAADPDPRIVALYSELVREYGADHMRVDHEHTSYRFIPAVRGEWPPVLADAPHGEIGPKSLPLFEDDLAWHVEHPGQRFGTKVYGKVWAYRDGHSRFQTYIPGVIQGRRVAQTGEVMGAPY